MGLVCGPVLTRREGLWCSAVWDGRLRWRVIEKKVHAVKYYRHLECLSTGFFHCT